MVDFTLDLRATGVVQRILPKQRRTQERVHFLCPGLSAADAVLAGYLSEAYVDVRRDSRDVRIRRGGEAFLARLPALFGPASGAAGSRDASRRPQIRARA